jgi:peptidoglycan/LPS O-acetylase OafA/YrhL
MQRPRPDPIAGRERRADAHGRLLYLDGWRALAIGGVIIDHFGTAKGINLGRAGVELFFVLSGRLMAQLLFVQNSGLGNFYYRRFSRVYPTVVALILGLLAAAWLLHRPLVDPIGVASALTYTYNYVSLAGYRSGMIDHLWSLCIEEHTYLFLGVLALAVRRAPRCLWYVLVGTLLANLLDGLISTLVLKQTYYEVYWRTDVRMASILMGAAAFMLKQQGRLELSGAWPIALGLIGVALNTNLVPDPVKYSVGSACLALAVANIDGAPLPVRRALSTKALTWVGLISFSLYVWQQPFSLGRQHPVILRLIPLSAALACALASFYWVEQPLRRWLNAHPPRWAAVRGEAASIDRADAALRLGGPPLVDAGIEPREVEAR